MIDLSELAGVGVPTVTVTVRGRAWTVRALTDLETQVIAEAFTTPRAPMIKDPTKGSLAAPIADYQDEGFRNRTRDWNASVQAARVAVAADLRGGVLGTGWEAAKASGGKDWLRAAAGQLRALLTDAEMETLSKAVDDAGKAGVTAEPPAG